MYVYRGALLPFAANGPLIRNTHPKLHSEALWRMMPPMGVDAYAHKNISFTNKRTDTRRTLTGPCFSPKTMVIMRNNAHNSNKVKYKTHYASRASLVLCLHCNHSKKIGTVYPSAARESKHLYAWGSKPHF